MENPKRQNHYFFMRATSVSVRSGLIAVLAMIAFALSASAVTVDPHTQAYGQYVWGDYILVGNSVMRCITSTDQDTRDANSNNNFTEVLGNVVAWAFYSQCATDTQQTTNPATFDPLPNDQRWMVYNNTDTTTSGIFNSSQATFSIPPGADIKFARLYWSGNEAEATNDGTLPAGQVAALQANGQAGTAASPWYSCNSGSASLTWTAYGTSGTVASNALVTTRQKAARRLDGQLNQMRIRVNSSAYQTITADEGPYSGIQNFGGVYYAAQADVTAYIQQQLDANEVASQATQLTVTGANIATGLGFNCYGGWSLAVVYAYPARNATYAPDYRFVEVFDGYAEAVSSTGSAGDPQNTDEVNIALSSFTPAAGVVEPRFGVVAWEGDQGLVGDQMQFEFGEPQQTTLTEPKINLTTNYFASTIGDYSNFSTGFNPSISRSPNYNNNDGVDIKVDGLNPTVLYNSGTNLNVRIFSSGDRFVIHAFTFSAVVASLSGTVYEDNNNNGQQDAGEAGIANVTLTLTGTDINNQPVNQTVTTNNVGYYVFPNVSPANASGYIITETQPAGYLDGKDTVGSTGGAKQAPDSIITIVFDPLATGSGTNYNFGELTPARLSGSVYKDLDGDGVQDAGEPGIPGVTVTLTGGANPVTAQTDANGFYQFTNLQPGTYTVTETDLNGYTSTGAEPGTVGSTVQNNNAIQVVLQVGENSQNNDFLDRLQPARLSGSVYEDLNGNGVQNIGEPGISGVSITLTGGASPITVQTDGAGFYQFTNLPPGTYTVTETDLNGYGSSGAEQGTSGSTVQNNNTIQVVLQPNDNSQTNDFLDVRPGSISGTVCLNSNGDGRCDANETGIQGVTVTLDDGNPNTPVVTTTTNANGDYTFTNLLPGNYTVTESDPPNYASVNDADGGVDNVIVVPVQSNQAVIDRDFVDQLVPGSISGSVYNDLNNNGAQDPGEPGISGVTITLNDTNVNTPAVIATTDSNGFYNFPTLLPDTYTVVETDLPSYSSTGAEPGTSGSTVTNSNTIQVVLTGGATSAQNDFLDRQLALSLAITKVLDSNIVEPVRVGDPVTFTIVITNTGQATITTLPLTDSYDRRYLAFTSATPAPVDTNDDQQIDWSDLTASFGQDLAPNQAFTIKVRFVAFHDTTAISPDGKTVNTAAAHDATSGSTLVPNPAPSTASVSLIAPTAVVLAEHTATYADGKVTLHWQSVSETEVVGYAILRREELGSLRNLSKSTNEWVRLTDQMIEAQYAGQNTGADYHYVDATVEPGHIYHYLLEVTDVAGQQSYSELANVSGGNRIFLSVVRR